MLKWQQNNNNKKKEQRLCLGRTKRGICLRFKWRRLTAVSKSPENHAVCLPCREVNRTWEALMKFSKGFVNKSSSTPPTPSIRSLARSLTPLSINRWQVESIWVKLEGNHCYQSMLQPVPINDRPEVWDKLVKIRGTLNVTFHVHL